ncbi:MAG: sialidase family protein [Phycisphaerales bacterium]|jgi:hypothetical protein|nr:sialidase family protein [Phycisphaerales bacterium]
MLTTLLLATSISMPHPPATAHAMAPSLCSTDRGVWATWLEPAAAHATATSDDVWRLRISRCDGAAWAPPRTITQRRDFFVNWADTPQIAVAGNGALVATWLQKSGPDTYAYDIGVARSTDDGQTWTMLGTLNDDRTQTEHGFVSMVPEGDGVRAVWLDGRGMSAGGHDDHGHGGGDMTLRTALITDAVGPSTRLDDRTCECCPTTMARTRTGVVAAYRDRSVDERRDIAVVRLGEDGWTAPADPWPDNWEINGCPVNGPAADADGLRVAVAWFTGGPRPGVRIMTSEDGGVTFDEPITFAGDEALGRVDVAWPAGGDPIVVWLSEGPADDTTHTLTMGTLQSGGDAPVNVAAVEAGRRSGYPRIAALPDRRCLIVWTARDRQKGLNARLTAMAAD